MKVRGELLKNLYTLHFTQHRKITARLIKDSKPKIQKKKQNKTGLFDGNLKEDLSLSKKIRGSHFLNSILSLKKLEDVNQ